MEPAEQIPATTSRASKTTGFWGSRQALIAIWATPFVIYSLALVARPAIFGDDNSSVGIDAALFTLGQPFVPVIAVLISAFFPTTTGKSLRPLTPDRFNLAVWCMGAFHLISGLYFFLWVLPGDYVAAETYEESFAGTLGSFAKIATYFSVIPLIPLRYLFERE